MNERIEKQKMRQFIENEKNETMGKWGNEILKHWEYKEMSNEKIRKWKKENGIIKKLQR